LRGAAHIANRYVPRFTRRQAVSGNGEICRAPAHSRRVNGKNDEARRRQSNSDNGGRSYGPTPKHPVPPTGGRRSHIAINAILQLRPEQCPGTRCRSQLRIQTIVVSPRKIPNRPLYFRHARTAGPARFQVFPCLVNSRGEFAIHEQNNIAIG
jgi:hypothetical protein